MKSSLLVIGLLSCRVGLAQPVKTLNPDRLKISTIDVSHFWAAYDGLKGLKTHSDSVQMIEQTYLKPGSYGLKQYQAASHSTAEDFLQAIQTHPQLLNSIRASTLSISAYRVQLIQGARKLKQLYPASQFPELFFVMGKFEVLGSQFDNFLYIGAELASLTKKSPRTELTEDLNAAASTLDNLDVLCLHELVHYQQKLQPKTNLDEALIEGGAEFIAHKLTGKSTIQSVFNQVSVATQQAIWQEFAEHLNERIDAKWFLNRSDPIHKRPGMLGYLIGFRLCEAYYNHAKDKKKALVNIITLTTPSAIYPSRTYKKS